MRLTVTHVLLGLIAVGYTVPVVPPGGSGQQLESTSQSQPPTHFEDQSRQNPQQHPQHHPPTGSSGTESEDKNIVYIHFITHDDIDHIPRQQVHLNPSVSVIPPNPPIIPNETKRVALETEVLIDYIEENARTKGILQGPNWEKKLTKKEVKKKESKKNQSQKMGFSNNKLVFMNDYHGDVGDQDYGFGFWSPGFAGCDSPGCDCRVVYYDPDVYVAKAGEDSAGPNMAFFAKGNGRRVPIPYEIRDKRVYTEEDG